MKYKDLSYPDLAIINEGRYIFQLIHEPSGRVLRTYEAWEGEGELVSSAFAEAIL